MLPLTLCFIVVEEGAFRRRAYQVGRHMGPHGSLRGRQGLRHHAKQDKKSQRQGKMLKSTRM